MADLVLPNAKLAGPEVDLLKSRNPHQANLIFPDSTHEALPFEHIEATKTVMTVAQKHNRVADLVLSAEEVARKVAAPKGGVAIPPD